MVIKETDVFIVENIRFFFSFLSLMEIYKVAAINGTGQTG